MTQIYFTSDLHFGHKKVSELRGFESVEDHDESILVQFARIPIQSQVWILGDLSGGSSFAEDAALKHLSDMKSICGFSLHLIAGNHDSVSSIHRDSFKKFHKFMEVFDSVQSFARRNIAGEKVMLSHFPYAGDSHKDERYKEYRLRDEGNWLLHGHTHQPGVLDSQRHPRQISVGWDAWGRPVEVNEIAKLIDRMKSMNPGLVNSHITV